MILCYLFTKLFYNCSYEVLMMQYVYNIILDNQVFTSGINDTSNRLHM